MRPGESPEEAARRETGEEVGTVPRYRVTGVDVQDCGGGWKFHLIRADVEAELTTYSAKETDATGWFTERMMDIAAPSGHPALGG